MADPLDSINEMSLAVLDKAQDPSQTVSVDMQPGLDSQKSAQDIYSAFGVK